ncbi:RimK family alpha-L-glutamate ligase [Bacillus sp. JCM 19034]|uniref:ATP-grasp domain-containing protein n=1 Tax=Bacillus sp. JCM 19034 TaxID=1481928 RepID=UPI000785D0A5|nr:hypothetical protein [Bacillus sp. JCM 19034]
MKKNLIITDYRGFLRRKKTKDESLDVVKIKKILTEEGYHFDITSFEEIAANYHYYSTIENSYIIYSASKNQEYNKYIDHVIYLLGKNNHLLPNYELFKAFDDKGFQELYKTNLGIESLGYRYLSNINSFYELSDQIKYPIVMKEMVSASSKGVYKVNDSKEVEDHYSRIINKQQGLRLKDTLKKFIKKKKKDYAGVSRVVLQEFVPNLKDDWKVLIFGEKYYVLNRKVRKNDFRASGSGDFAYISPPLEVLEKARETFLNLNTPFLSVDLAFDGENAYIIEIQALNFGPITLLNSSSYYIKENNEWLEIAKKSDLDEEYANAYIWMINRIQN